MDLFFIRTYDSSSSHFTMLGIADSFESIQQILNGYVMDYNGEDVICEITPDIFETLQTKGVAEIDDDDKFCGESFLFYKFKLNECKNLHW